MDNGNFVIVCDIDGVVYKARVLIDGSKKAIKMIKSHNIPLMFITNDRGMQESKKAKLITNLSDTPIEESQVILSHTPFRDLGKPYREKRTLVIGVHKEECFRVMRNYGFKNLVFFDDYLDERPYLLNFYCPRNQNPNPNQKIIPKEEILKEEPFGAIFVLHEPTNWYTGLQLCIDILSTNGSIGKTVDFQNFKDYDVPIFISNPDLEYSGTFFTPRLTAGAFAETIKSIFFLKTGSELKHLVQCGKPLKYSFEYVENFFKDKKIERYYLIGDNPKSDICGANKRSKWFSILVKSGVYSGEGNDKVYPAKKVCKDLLNAVNFIFKEENIL